MSDRMQKITETFARQAGIVYEERPELGTWTAFDSELTQFAELIVRECAGIVEDYGLSLVGSDENYLGETLNLSIRVQEAGNKIKKHFGVEE